MDKPGVIAFRDRPDVTAMDEAAAEGRRVAVIGGGLLGIEAAYGLARRGADVTLVHVVDRLMERQLDARAAALVAKALARKGVKVLFDRKTVAVTGDSHATGLAFADGASIAADLVVSAVGVRPNADLAKAAGLAVGRGVIVDDGLSASLPGFHAIGECAEHRGIAYGLVEPAHAQAEVLARRLTGEELAFNGMRLATNLKVSACRSSRPATSWRARGATRPFSTTAMRAVTASSSSRDGGSRAASWSAIARMRSGTSTSSAAASISVRRGGC